jgi:hypothetical protein
MKRLVTVLATIALIAGFGQLSLIFGGHNLFGGSTAEGLRAAAVPTKKDQTTPAAPARTAEPFAVGTSRHVELTLGEAPADLSRRQRHDQFLDWLLFTSVAAFQPSLATYNQIMFDIPAVRAGYLHDLGTFEFGDTRSRFVGDGNVLALIPTKREDAQRKDLLAHIADEQRKNIGKPFEKMIVLEYDLDIDHGSAVLTRQHDIPSQTFFSEAYGYTESKVSTLAEFTSFLSKVDDLTSVSVQDSALLLGGRKIFGHHYRSAKLEHVAALWRADQDLQQALAAWKERENSAVDNFNAQWRHRTYRTEFEKSQLEAQRDKEWAAVEQKLLKEREDLKLVNSTGFSLDPTYDYAGLKTAFVAALPAFQSLRVGGKPLLTSQASAEVVKALGDKDVVPLLKLSEDVSAAEENGGITQPTDHEKISRKLVQLKWQYAFQAARYDGKLQGTEAGMVLFYTDLLAKLWVIDYLHSSPVRQIPNFVDGTHVRLAAMYEDEVRKLPSARLWFGYSNLGFQIAPATNSLYLARNATRIYAAGSNPLDPGHEVQTSAALLAPLEWWNDHYEEVAAYEPEYELLNEIMKWSIVIGWLDQHAASNKLGFLANGTVDHSNVFPDWVRKHPELRFDQWDSVGFFPPGHNGAATESLPLLMGPDFVRNSSIHWLGGGVSLAEKDLFAKRAPITSELENTVVPRSNLNYSASRSEIGSFETFDKTVFTVKDVDANTVSVAIHAKPEAKLRGATAQLTNAEIERTIAARGADLNIETRANGFPLGELEIVPAENGFVVGWHSRLVDQGHSIARSLSEEIDPDAVLRADPRVDAVIRLPGNSEYAIKLKGSAQWLHMTKEGEPRADIAPGQIMRVSVSRDTERTMQIALVDEGQLQALLKAHGSRIVVDGSYDDGRFFATVADDPAPGTGVVDVDGVTWRARAWLDADKRIHLASRDPSENLDIVAATQQLKPEDMSALRDAIARSAPSIQLPKMARLRARLAVDLEKHDVQDISVQIAADPDAAQRAIDTIVASEVKRADEVRDALGSDAALQRLNGLIDVFGRRPELMLRRGIVEIERRNVNEAIANAKQAVARPIDDRKSLFDEIDARLQDGTVVGDKTDLYNFARYSDWRDMMTYSGPPLPPAGDLHPVLMGDGHFGMDLQLASMPDGKPLGLGDLNQVTNGKPVIYYQDTASLNSIDWNASTDIALRQIVTGDMGRVIHLPRQDIAHFQPAQIWTPDHTVAFKQATSSNHGLLNHGMSTGYQPCNVVSQLCPDDSSGQTDKREVYLVVANK